MSDDYTQGWQDAIECAARSVEYHCDCTHADVPGLVRLLACHHCKGIASYECPYCQGAEAGPPAHPTKEE